MKYRPILGVLGYVLSPDRKKVLMVHRTAREDDDHLGKFNGLGGKLEKNEDIVEGIKREIHEEAGILCTELKLRGTINWNGFGPKLEDWFGFIFLITDFEGEVNDESPEGPLEWVPISQLDKLPMWEGDRHFLPLIFDDDPHPFHGYMLYENEDCLKWEFNRI
ncbi:MAG: 8-oxo-dGTP diphosphatase [Simkaniaceae bacterium]|nr:8-oxo-dGTP diphosphatase [Simkaniaceae bacterium]